MTVELGTELPPRVYRVPRADLVRYAGASGDFNPIHWSDRTAAKVGLPGVIAHGMYTMALAGQAVLDWVGDPAAVVDYGVRFSAMEESNSPIGPSKASGNHASFHSGAIQRPGSRFVANRIVLGTASG